jgi:ABC-2 type transport system ATP-binding protein
LGEKPSYSLQRRIGYMPEERGLYRGMTVGQQLMFFARLKGLRKEGARKRMRWWLSRLGLSRWENKNATELSKGMQQKVQFISTLLHKPKLLILDEPFSGLDPVSVSVLKEILMALKKEGRTIIFSSHQMEQVEQICDDICLINNGRELLGGSLSDVKRSHGKNTILLDCNGPDSWLTSDAAYQIKRFPTYFEIKLNDGANAQDIIRRAVVSGATVNRFEIVEPSLNEIFIERVQGDARNGHEDLNSSI